MTKAEFKKLEVIESDLMNFAQFLIDNIDKRMDESALDNILATLGKVQKLLKEAI